MARYLQLEPGVGYGLVGDRAVFLDLRRDRYLALDPQVDAHFRQLRAANEPLLPDGPEGDLLLATGLFRTASLRGRLSPTQASAPRQSLLDETPHPRAGWIAPVRAWAALKRARALLATTPIHTVVDAIRERRFADPPVGDATFAEEQARLFHAARALVPVERSCLADALALLDWLGDEAGHAVLVFGVRMEPFGAHCWLQTERLLLTDAHDTIGNFVPVMAV